MTKGFLHPTKNKNKGIHMDIKTYSELALRTYKDMGNPIHNAMHMASGIAGESGEIIDIVKKSFAYGKALDRDHLIEEIGDEMWYLNGILHVLGTTWDEVLAKNIAKLQARYPEGYTDYAATNRDKVAEKEAMTLY